MYHSTGSAFPDKRLVKTKLRHFAQTTSPQITALSQGKHLPLSSTDSPPTLSPASPLSPLTVSISLDHLHCYQNQSTTSTPYPSVANTVSFAPSQESSVPKVRKRRGRPPKNKARLAALSSFVMKKRACSPSTHSDSPLSSSLAPPPKRVRIGSESDSSINDGGSGDKSGVYPGSEGASSLLTVKRHFRSATGAGSTNYYSILSSSRAPAPPLSSSHTCNQEQSDAMDTVDDTPPANSPAFTSGQTPASHEKLASLRQHQDTPNSYWDLTNGGSNSATDGVGMGGGTPHQLLLDEDDRFSVTSSTTSAPTAINQTSLSTNRKGKSQTSITPLGGTTSVPPQRRGRPPKNLYSNGGNLSSELQSLMSTSKSSINFDQVFSYYPPKLVVKDGELLPERSLSIKRIERSALNGLPESHPFWSWNLGQPVKASVTLRGRGRKRKPPKAVHVT